MITVNWVLKHISGLYYETLLHLWNISFGCTEVHTWKLYSFSSLWEPWTTITGMFDYFDTTGRRSLCFRFRENFPICLKDILMPWDVFCFYLFIDYMDANQLLCRFLFFVDSFFFFFKLELWSLDYQFGCEYQYSIFFFICKYQCSTFIYQSSKFTVSKCQFYSCRQMALFVVRLQKTKVVRFYIFVLVLFPQHKKMKKKKKIVPYALNRIQMSLKTLFTCLVQPLNVFIEMLK